MTDAAHSDSVPIQPRVHEVHRADLPLSCPLPSMSLWNSHPRVYLAIEAEGGRVECPYCGEIYVLVD